MLGSSILGFLLVLPAPHAAQAVQAAKVADAGGAIEKELAHVRELVQRGSFDRADQKLKELLVHHERSDAARLRQDEIVELARRCAFQLGRDAPKLAQLVSGELVRYDPKGGDLEIRYAPTKTKDFETEVEDEGALLIHPAFFVESLTIEVDCPAGMAQRGDGPTFLVGLDTDESFEVCFGNCPPETDDEADYVPPQILRMKASGTEVVASHDKPAAPYDKKCQLKIVVGSGSITAFRDGKRLLQAKRSVRAGGQFALPLGQPFDRLTLRGKIQPSWPQGLLDAATQAAMTKFQESWHPDSALPAWLFEPVAGASKDGSPTAGGEPPPNPVFTQRLDDLDALDGERPPAELEPRWKELAADFPDEPDAWVGLGFVELELGRLDQAQATCDAALARGLTRDALDPLPQLLVQARTGPEWTRVFSVESDHYLVKSDIDRETCSAASKLLEESYRAYGLRLAPVSDAEKRKFVVYLFSGESGYGEYVKDTLFDEMPSTAGVYSVLLKQLLIWNLPDRAEMFLTVRHEGFHQYLDRLAPDPPLWFDEGMASYFELADLYGGEWKEGQVDADYVALLEDEPEEWVPLPTLFAMGDEEFQGGDVDEHYAESWAVVHYLRQGPKEMQELFKKLWSAVVAGKPPDTVTQEAFGTIDLGVFEAAVRAHVHALGK